MKHTKDRTIILVRRNYGEHDRIISVLGQNFGKATLMAKGTRKAKSKLAGSIELFSEADIEYIEGRGNMHTLTGARLYKNYSNISSDIDRTMQAYEFLKILNKIIQEGHGSEYYEILVGVLSALDDSKISLELIKAWFFIQSLNISGHLPSLGKNANGNKLPVSDGYSYDFDAHCFEPNNSGKFAVNNIKLMRLLASANKVPKLNNEAPAKQIAQLVEQLVRLQVY